jgi:hypothetical protein
MTIKDEKLALNIKVTPLNSEYDKIITAALLEFGSCNSIYLMRKLKVTHLMAKQLINTYCCLT